MKNSALNTKHSTLNAQPFSWPSLFDDSLQVTVEVVKVGASQIVMAQQVRRGGEVLVAAEVRLACVDRRTFKPVRIPGAMVTRMGRTS